MTRLLINIPYASDRAPAAVTGRLGLSEDQWRAEHFYLTDPHLLWLARAASVYRRGGYEFERPLVVYPYSPLVADPWGFWAGELGGRAVEAPSILPATTSGRPINWSPADRDVLFRKAVSPYYAELENKIENILADAPAALVLTLRSFSSQPLPFEADKRRPRPQAAVSSSGPATPKGLIRLAGNVFKSLRWWAELGWPQRTGACLPPGALGRGRVLALGLSLNRGLYMDEKSGRRLPSADGAARVLKTFFNLLEQELERAGRLAAAGTENRYVSPVLKAGRS